MAHNTRFATSIQALVLLAAEPDKLHRSEDVAQKIGTNPVVIRRIFQDLRRASLIVSHKGPKGGSKLALSPREITLRDIHRALHPHGNLQAPPSSPVPGLASVLKSAFSDASRALEKELNEVTLSQLVKRALKKSLRSNSASASA